jgi:hypothetical protein
MSAPATLLGHRNVTPGSVPETIRRAWADCLMALLGLVESSAPFCAQEADVPEIGLDLIAQGEATAFSREIEEGLNPNGGRWSMISSTAGKAVGLAGRIAALLHLAEHGPDGLRMPINEITMRSAIAIVRTHLLHAERMAATGGDAQVVHDARCIVEWAGNVNTTEFSERQALNGARKHRAGPNDMARVRAALRLLDDRGWVRKRAEEERGQGRPASPIWQINPGVAA